MLYHTSPNEIAEINNDGAFGSFLFFSSRVYVMSLDEYVTYTIDEENIEFIEAGSIFYHEDAAKADHVVAEAMEYYGVDEDTAIELIDETLSTNNIELDYEVLDPSEAAWAKQFFTARAAAALGYRGVEVEDEQGTAYMIDMMGRESDLTREK